jgi:ABC-2 type transport system permease protein
MDTRMKRFLKYLRIIGVLARKDILEGLRNRNILVLFLSVGFIIVLYKALPGLSAGNEPPGVLVYDAGHSALTEIITGSSNLTAKTPLDSEAAMLKRLRDGDTPALGLIIPADFDDSVKAGSAPVLQGYVMYWVGKEDALALKETVEAEISRLAGRAVSISIEGNTVYGVPEQDGAGIQASMALIFALIMLGISLIPNILLDEKQARTLDVLMVSPASGTQIAAGKAAAGLFYSAAVGILALAVNYRLVMHWELAAAAVLCFGLLTVLLGLILSSWVDTRAQFQLTVWMFVLPLIAPLILFLLADLLPPAIGQILPIFPPVTMMILMRFVYADPISWGVPLLCLGWLLVWILAELAVFSWLLKRTDRAEKPIAAANGLSGSEKRRGESAAGRSVPVTAAAPNRTRERISAVDKTGGHAFLRMVLAIAGKDIRDALRNRLFLSIMVGALFIAVNGAVFPMLINWRHLPSAVIFDEGNSSIGRELAIREDCRVILAGSREEMETEVVGHTDTWIGLILPADFDRTSGEAGGIDLEAEIAHWVSPGAAEKSIAFFETQLDRSDPAAVGIHLSESRLYPSAESSGSPLLNLFTQIQVLVIIGFFVVPLLLVEEKESRTMDALMVSPAGFSQILTGKTLAGLAFCLAAGLVIVLINVQMIVHWDILLAALVLSSAFFVSVGLLIGTLTNTPTSAAFWGSPLMILAIGSVLLEVFPNAGLPAGLREILSGSPASLILRMFRLALAGHVPANMVWQAIAALGAMAAVVYILVVWIMQRKYNA